ncbi:hypothetical protein TNCV_2381221 [Trichonephila clavipes]|nr:hypothetical protein TNCV_2381221 [Trichonephila clavipes]
MNRKSFTETVLKSPVGILFECHRQRSGTGPHLFHALSRPTAYRVDFFNLPSWAYNCYFFRNFMNGKDQRPRFFGSCSRGGYGHELIVLSSPGTTKNYRVEGLIAYPGHAGLESKFGEWDPSSDVIIIIA